MKSKSLTFVVMLVLILSLALPTSIAKATPPNCTCVEYVKAYFGITEAVGNAKDMGTWLINHGFVQVSSPQVGDVAVMQPGFTGVTDPAGHVGIIASASLSGSQWKITLRGANQTVGSTQFSEFGCNNVRNTPWGAYSNTNTKIKYYRAYKYAIKSAMNGLYFDVEGGSTSDGAYVIGWPYHGGNNQLFNFIRYGSGVYRIIARNSAKCIQPQNTSQGARLVQKKCTGSNIELWVLYQGYVLKNLQTGYVVDLAGGSSSPGTWIVQWSSHGGNNQKWSLEVK
jgi:hypothetical protein